VELDAYRWIFLHGWFDRSLGVLVLLLIIEKERPPGRRSSAQKPHGKPREEGTWGHVGGS
jgi:hypothetical protein